MKVKLTVIIIFILTIIVLYGCQSKQLTLEQSRINFANYYKEIEQITKKHNIVLEKGVDSMIENQDSYVDLNILIDDNEIISMRLINSAFDSDKGVESFNIIYTINECDGVNDFNTDLFVELTNTVSGKPISKEQCIDFLLAPEHQYEPKNYGLSKSEDMITYKYYPLNFEADWSMYYKLYQNNTEILEFGGLTKQSTTHK